MARRAWGVVSGVRYAGSPTSASVSPQPTISSVTVAIAANGDLTLTIDGSNLDLATGVTFGALSGTIDAQAAGQITASGWNAYTDGFRFGLSADVVVTDGSNPDTASATVPQPSTATAFGEISGYDALVDPSVSAYWQISADPAVADGWFGYLEDRNSISGLSFTVATGVFSADGTGLIYVRAFNPAGTGVHGQWTAETSIVIGEEVLLSEDGSAVDGFDLSALSLAILEATSASDSYAEAVSIALTAAAAATDSVPISAQAFPDLTGAVTAADLSAALAQASAALVAGAVAGEQWVGAAAQLAEFLASGVAGESFEVIGAEEAQEAAINEGTTAAEAFLGAVQAVAAITGAASAEDAFSATVQAIAEIGAGVNATSIYETGSNADRVFSESANAQDAPLATAQVADALVAAAIAAAGVSAVSAAGASVIESAAAQAIFTALGGQGSFLITGAIQMVALLSAKLRFEPH